MCLVGDVWREIPLNIACVCVSAQAVLTSIPVQKKRKLMTAGVQEIDIDLGFYRYRVLYIMSISLSL